MLEYATLLEKQLEKVHTSAEELVAKTKGRVPVPRLLHLRFIVVVRLKEVLERHMSIERRTVAAATHLVLANTPVLWQH